MEKMRKMRQGRVLNNKMDKTIVVEVETRRKHPRYKKIIRHRAKFKVHDEGNICGVGDMVKIVETRPVSKDKNWRVKEVLRRAEVIDIKPEEIE